MKKLLTVTLTLIMLISSIAFTALAETNTLSADVYVTISDKDGKLVLIQEKIQVTDTDNDGSLTINDALYAAHESKYNGGAAAGYESSLTQYGLSLDKLWGTANGGSYGYGINNKSALSLSDPVKNGDYINAYVYTDLTSWSDTYCYFDLYTVNTFAGKEISLTLTANSFDAQFNPIVVPVENATITLNGEKTEFKTDKDGKATITITSKGDYIISAVSDTQTLVPPACKAVVTEEIKENTPPSNTDNKPQPEETAKTENKSPKTKDNSINSIVFAIMLISLAVTITLIISKRKFYE